MIDSHRLKIFMKVADLKSFSRAAHELYLTQPTVSQHVTLLEEHLGLKLFDRSGREVSLTGAGRLLYGYARQVIALQDEAAQAMDHFRGRKTGHLVIGASTIPGEYLLPGMLGAFRRSYPDIRLTVRISDTGGIIDELLNRSIELAVAGARIRDDRLHYSRFVEDELVLVVPRGHRLCKRRSVESGELVEEAFVIREQGSGTRIAMEKSLHAAGIDPVTLRVAAEVGSTTAVKEGVRAGLGISFISRRAVRDELKSGALKAVAVAGASFKRSFYIVTERNRTLSPLGRALAAFLQARR